ncbi:nucleotidyltransferase [Dyadobacter jiangsuensis]|uniref:nucleotidyltransferase n=1 Tax=Dyadobacter TaxID=120831 RepID=UPI001CBE5F6B|nr:nucleotidyltransferase [Dyadobacter fermentans]MBZ1360704.1 nucleotidyltransferase [Dyadobacter fermentans]
MGNIFNDDFQDFLKSFNECEVEYILVGGYSVILHGYSRTTGDMDIWVRKTSENYRRIANAFEQFGMPLFDMTETNFLHNPQFDVFTFGRVPVSIDLITKLKGLEFEEAYKNAADHAVEGLKIRLIHYKDLITAKKAAGRPRDINDIENLENSSD